MEAVQHLPLYVDPNSSRVPASSELHLPQPSPRSPYGYSSMEGTGRTVHPELNYSSDLDEIRGGHSSSYDDYDSEDLDQTRRRSPAWIQRLKALAVVACMVGAVWLITLAVADDWLDTFAAWAKLHETLAAGCLVVLFIPAALLFAPLDVPLYLIAGFMYGVAVGSFVCWVGYLVGASVGFAAARYAFKDWFYRRTRNSVFLSAVQLAVHSHAFALVLLLQVAPLMPYSMVCFFFGTSDCDFGLYVAGTAIGVIPNVVFFCFVGASMKTMAEAASGADSNGGSGTAAYEQNSAYWYYFWGSGFAAVVAVTLLTVAAKQHLDELLATALATQRERADRRRPGAAAAVQATNGGDSATVVALASADGRTTTRDRFANYEFGPATSARIASAPPSESSNLELNRRPLEP